MHRPNVFSLIFLTSVFVSFNIEGEHEVLDLLGGTVQEDSTKNARQAQDDTNVCK